MTTTTTPSARPAATTRRLRLVAMPGLLLCLALAGCPGDGRNGGGGSSRPVDRMAFEPAQVVQAARVLDGDPASERCPDATQPCFRDDGDILGGQRVLAGVDDMQVAFVSQVDSRLEMRIATLKTGNSSFTDVSLDAPASDPPGLLRNATALGVRAGGVGQRLARLELMDTGQSDGTLRTRLSIDGVSRSTDRRQLSGHLGLSAAAADFAGDGVESIVYTTGDWIGVATPVVRNGVVGDVAESDALPIDRVFSLTTARIFDATPVAVAAAIGSALELQFFGVNATRTRIDRLAARTLTVTLREGHRVAYGSERVVAGHFTDTAYEQVVVAFDELDAGGQPLGVTLVLVTRDADGALRQHVTSGALPGRASRTLRLAKGRFLAGDPYEGLVVMQDFGVAGGGRIDVSLMTYPSPESVRVVGGANVPSNACSFGMDTGHFDRRVVRDDNSTVVNRNLQLGLLLGLDCAGGVTRTLQAAIWQISPANAPSSSLPLVLRGTGADTASAVLPIDLDVPVRDPIVGLSLAVLDLQGRSQVLGAPRVLTVEDRTQPSVVVAAPPMHVDWVGDTLTNLTAAPGGFFSRYTVASSDDVQAQTRSTSTWSVAVEESIDGKLSYGTCGQEASSDCLTVEDKVTAKQELGGSTAAVNRRFATQALDISQSTAFDDVVWYTDSTLTIYAYPVIGRTTCPTAKPRCAESEKVPVTLMVAGPDTVRQSSADASLLAWYQPPWVAGQLLSYPATVEQMKTAALSDPTRFKALSQARTWAIDDTAAEQKATWITGEGTGTSVSSTNNFSGNNTLSIAGKGGLAGSLSGSLSVQVSVGGSRGFQNLTDSQTTLTRTTGLSFGKSAQFEGTPDYSYQLTPYVFAQTTPAGADAAPTSSDGFGILQSGFVADLNTAGGGTPRAFWADHYAVGADLALLHPSRLTVTPVLSPPGDRAACVRLTAASYECASAIGAAADKLRYDEHRWMRGFFVSEAAAAGRGPQKISATEGDRLLLQARVHNLSLSAMRPGTQVKARFYGMVWDLAGNARVGRSFPICDAPGACVRSLGPAVVPPYHTGDATPNWSLISQAFDTSGHGGQDLYFWVVVWMEDAAGNLVAEPNQRGLDARPTDAMDFEDVARLEQRHGNNVGFFNAPFHVFDARSTAPARAGRSPGRPALQIVEVGAEDRWLLRGQSTLVAARVRVGEFDLPRGTTVVFHDGVPGPGTRIVGQHRQPFMRADTTYDLRVPFRSNLCGSHDLHVVTGPGTRFEHVARLPPIRVACS